MRTDGLTQSSIIAERLESRRLLAAGPNISVTTDAGVQQTPSVAVDPHATRHLVLAYMDRSLVNTGYAGIGVAISTNGGSTWRHRALPLPTGFDQGASNPVATFDDLGHVFISFEAATFKAGNPALTNPDGGAPRALGFKSNNGIFVSRSDDGGLSWNPSVAVTSHSYDGAHAVPFEIFPTLAIDTRIKLPGGKLNPRYNTLYVGWTRYYGAGQFPGKPDSTGGSDVFIAASSDLGSTWNIRTTKDKAGVSQTVLKDTVNQGNAPEGFGVVSLSHPSVGPDGDVYVGYYSGGHYGVAHSTDGGKSFAIPTFEAILDRQPFRIDQVALVNGKALMPQNQFRTVPQRAIATDPTHPGVVYAAEAVVKQDDAGRVIDRGDILFSYSTDYGEKWNDAIVINDDNGNQRAAGSVDDVTADQIMVRLSVGTDGRIGVVWLDSRNDPASKLLDVFGAVGKLQIDSSGKSSISFSPNFRITNSGFDSNNGKFNDALGEPDYYFGDSIGLAMSPKAMNVAWTDTRNANQDVFFSSVPLDPLPAPPNDRFEPNDSIMSATDLGTLIIRHLPRLTLGGNDADWFSFSSLSSGTITIDAKSSGASNLQMDLLNPTGSKVFASSVDLLDATGKPAGKRVSAAGLTAQHYLLRVRRTNTSADRDLNYSLDLESMTGALGKVVYRSLRNSLQPEDQAYYLLTTAAAGSLRANLDLDPSFAGTATLELLDAQSLNTLASATGKSPRLKLQVNKNQALVVHVTAAFGGQGSYSLKLTNLDQYSDSARNVLHFPAGLFPSQETIGDFNGDQVPDVAIANAGANTASVLLANKDGTFEAPRQFTIGAAQYPNPEGFSVQQSGLRRAIVTADFDRDGRLDLAVTNYDSGDVSILLGRGDGTFSPQRRYNALSAVFALVQGDVNGDGIVDLVVADAELGEFGTNIAAMLGRGDGSFLPPKIQALRHSVEDVSLLLDDLDKDGKLDLAVAGGGKNGVEIFTGDGQGNFKNVGQFLGGRQSPMLISADINRDGNPDILSAGLSIENAIWGLFGNGDGTLQQPPEEYLAGQSPAALALADWGTSKANQTFDQGTPDGLPDLIVANAGTPQGVVSSVGPPEIVVLPNLGFDSAGRFLGFGDPIQLSQADQPLDVKIADFNGDGNSDIGVVDLEEFFVIYGKAPQLSPNNTRAAARDLGVVVHLLQPTFTIVPDHAHAWYSMVVPTEAARGSGPQIVDLSALFSQTRGANLNMEVTDQEGHVLGSGEHIRIAAAQGAKLFVHVFGKTGSNGDIGTGAYTLNITVLPQVVSLEAQSLLPGPQSHGGAVATLVLTFQGERLDPQQAEVPGNYTITWLGRDGIPGTLDDQMFSPSAIDNHPVVYNPGANVDVSSGRTYPTAVRQTVSLLFGRALPSGSYRIQISPRVQAVSFNEIEPALIHQRHPIVSSNNGSIIEGSDFTIADAVSSSSTVPDFSLFMRGTPFLSQLHGDLSALLDQQLSSHGDASPELTTQAILRQIIARMQPAASELGKSLVALFLDPVGIDLTSSNGSRLSYSLASGALSNQIENAFVSVASNVELVVLPIDAGMLTLNVNDVPATARGGAIIMNDFGVQLTQSITNDLRHGQDHFQFAIEEPSITSPSDPIIMRPELKAMNDPQLQPRQVSVTIIVETRTPPTSASAHARIVKTVTTFGYYSAHPYLSKGAAPGGAQIVGRFLQSLTRLISAVRSYFPPASNLQTQSAVAPQAPADIKKATKASNPKTTTQPSRPALSPANAPLKSQSPHASVGLTSRSAPALLAALFYCLSCPMTDMRRRHDPRRTSGGRA